MVPRAESNHRHADFQPTLHADHSLTTHTTPYLRCFALGIRRSLKRFRASQPVSCNRSVACYPFVTHGPKFRQRSRHIALRIKRPLLTLLGHSATGSAG